jgi:hypothetical protein
VLRTFRPVIPPDGSANDFQTYEPGAHYSVLEKHLSHPLQYEPMTLDRLCGVIASTAHNEEQDETSANALISQPVEAKKKRKAKANTIRRALAFGAAEYGAQLVEEVISASGIEGNTPASQVTDESSHPRIFCVNVDSS